MKTFDIIKRDKYIFIQSVCYKNPINNLDEVSSKLEKIRYTGIVIFDLLLINGSSSNRFLCSNYNNGFNMKSFKKITLPHETRKEIILYYKQHKSYLYNSNLSSVLINKILKEKCLDE